MAAALVALNQVFGDCYAVDAKKGERFTFDVIAQRHGSRLDSLLRILGIFGGGSDD